MMVKIVMQAYSLWHDSYNTVPKMLSGIILKVITYKMSWGLIYLNNCYFIWCIDLRNYMHNEFDCSIVIGIFLLTALLGSITSTCSVVNMYKILITKSFKCHNMLRAKCVSPTKTTFKLHIRWITQNFWGMHYGNDNI